MVLPCNGHPGLLEWEAVVGVEIPRGGWYASGELRMRCLGSRESAVEVLVPQSTIVSGLCGDGRRLEVTEQAAFAKAILDGFARRVGPGEDVPTGRLAATEVGRKTGGCVPWVLRGLGWMVGDLWAVQTPRNLREWGLRSFPMGFPGESLGDDGKTLFKVPE